MKGRLNLVNELFEQAEPSNDLTPARIEITYFPSRVHIQLCRL